MSNIRIEDIVNDISITPTERVMRDQKPDNTRWVLVIRRGLVLCFALIVFVLRLFDSFDSFDSSDVIPRRKRWPRL